MPAISEDSAATQLVASPVTVAKPANHAPVRMVQGSSGGLTAETNRLLAIRLRSLSLGLAAGWIVFAILLALQPPIEGSLWRLAEVWYQRCVTVFLALVAWRICVKCPVTFAKLRLVEFTIFGAICGQFLISGVTGQFYAAEQGFLIDPIPPWLMSMFVYALFIPNSWQRAAAMIGCMAMLALTCLWLPAVLDPAVSALLGERQVLQTVFFRQTFGVLFCAGMAIWGVRTIGQLRQRVYEAQQIGQYRLKQLLGRGGMGEVHLAEHVLLRRPCAVKLILTDKAGDPRALARFEREVQSTAKLTHWNTVEIYDYGRTDEGVFYYVMEYLPGLNLQQVVERNGPLPPERVIHFLTQACDALHEAHARGMVHRDIKPANIFSASRGGIYDVVKLLDFGLVRDRHAEETDVSVTQQGVITGSPLFMSPEQVQGDTPDARSDLYSLGIVGYFLLTGKVPFQYEKPIKVLLAHAQETPRPVSGQGVSLPEDLATLIMKCLEKSPAQRFQSALEFQRALKQCSVAGLWTREKAAYWWQANACPVKSALDAEVLDQMDCRV